MREGYVKLWRKTLDSWIIRDEKALQIWVWILLNAQWQDGHEIRWRGDLRKLKRGEFYLGTRHISGELGMTRASARRALNRLKAALMVTLEAAHDGTVGTIINWDTYQSFANDSGPSSGPSTGQIAALERPLSGHQQEVKKERSKEPIKTEEGREDRTVKDQIIEILTKNGKTGFNPISFDAFLCQWGPTNVLAVVEELDRRKKIVEIRRDDPQAYLARVLRERENAETKKPHVWKPGVWS